MRGLQSDIFITATRGLGTVKKKHLPRKTLSTQQAAAALSVHGWSPEEGLQGSGTKARAEDHSERSCVLLTGNASAQPFYFLSQKDI